jgi:hypothetical protein
MLGAARRPVVPWFTVAAWQLYASCSGARPGPSTRRPPFPDALQATPSLCISATRNVRRSARSPGQRPWAIAQLGGERVDLVLVTVDRRMIHRLAASLPRPFDPGSIGLTGSDDHPPAAGGGKRQPPSDTPRATDA